MSPYNVVVESPSLKMLELLRIGYPELKLTFLGHPKEIDDLFVGRSTKRRIEVFTITLVVFNFISVLFLILRHKKWDSFEVTN